MKWLRFKPGVLVINLSWTLIAEAVSKISRLVVIIVLAACLTPVEYGVACLAVVCHELIRVFSRSGAGAKIIQSPKQLALSIAENALLIQWVSCIAIALIQIILSNAIAQFYGKPELSELLRLMSISYLFYPLVATKVFMLQRENKLKIYSFILCLSVSFENLMIVILAWFGMGVSSVAYAKICGGLVWCILFLRVPVVNVRPAYDPVIMPKVLTFSLNVLGTELTKLVRFNLDLFVAGKMLTPDFFGVYSLAKNAGIGIGQSITTAYVTVVYPYLCNHYRENNFLAANKTAYKFSIFVCGLFLLQAFLAPYYVPLIFSQAWAESISIVAILCLAGIPALLVDTNGTMLRAQNREKKEFVYLLICVFISAIGLIVFSPSSPLSFAFVITGCAFVWPVIILGICQRVFVNDAKRTCVSSPC